MDQDQTEKSKHSWENKNGEVKTQTTKRETPIKKDWKLSVDEGHNRAGFVCGIPC